MTTNQLFIQFQFFLTFSCTITVINNDIDVNDQGAQSPSIQIFVNHFKGITREKFKVFVLKLATSDFYLTFL